MWNRSRRWQERLQTLFSKWRLKRKPDCSNRRWQRASKIRMLAKQLTRMHKWSWACLKSQRMCWPNSQIPRYSTKLGKRLLLTLQLLICLLRNSMNSSTINALKNSLKLKETSTEVEKGSLLLTVPDLSRIWVHNCSRFNWQKSRGLS